MTHLSGVYLSAYSDGELDAVTAALVAAHLKECPACRQRLTEMRAASALVRAHRPQPATADLTPAVLAAAVRIDARREQARVRSRHTVGVAILLVVAVACGWVMRQSAPVLLGGALWRMVGAMASAVFPVTAVPVWSRLALLLALAVGGWGAARRLRRALHQAELRP